jgi:DNA-binding MarR family transcriptional regulator
MAQYNVLRVLGEASGGLTRSEIGDRLVGTNPDTTRLLERLAKQRLVRRRRDVRDRRAVLTEITEEGRRRLASANSSLDAGVHGLFEHWCRAVHSCGSNGLMSRQWKMQEGGRLASLFKFELL